MVKNRTKSTNPIPKTLPGAVCVQMVRCGKPNCKCARGKLHGPYFYHFTRVNGVLVKRYVKAQDATAVRAACDARREKKRRQSEERKDNSRQFKEFMKKMRESDKLLFRLLEVFYGQKN